MPGSWTAGRVKATVRTLLDDDQGSWVTDNYLAPKIALVYDNCNTKLISTQSQWDIGVVEIPAVQPGTPNLADQQTQGGLLAQMTAQPLRIDWKPAGQPVSNYLLVPNFEVLPDIQPAQYVVGWEYRSDVIWLTPCTMAIDLRIRGEFGPPDLNADASVLTSHPRIGEPVSYGVAALVAVVRGNAAWVAAYKTERDELMDEIMTELVRDEQGQIRRLGRQTRRGGWGRGMVGPTAQ